VRAFFGACVVFVAGGCTTILGDDFEIISGSGAAAAAGGTAGAGATGGSGGSGGVPVRDVNGTQSIVHVNVGSEDTEQPDLSGATVDALVWSGTAFDHFTGEGHSNGTFTIPNVPEGAYYLDLESVVQGLVFEPAVPVTSASQIDMGYRVLGRADIEPVTLPTPVTLDIPGMKPWVDGDTLELWVAGAGIIEFFFYDLADTPPMPNDAFLGFTFDSATLFNPNLVNGVKGDQAIVAHFGAAPSAMGIPFSRINDTAHLPSFTQTDGQQSFVNGAFDLVPTNQTLTFDFKATQFEALVADIHPMASVGSEGIFLSALPGSMDYGFYSGTADLLLYNAPGGADISDSCDWGNPLGPNWSVHGGVYILVSVPIALPGTMPTNINSPLTYFAPLADLQALPELVPQIAPPASPKVDGADMVVDQTLDSLTPLVSWDPPTIGTATRYVVNVLHLYAQGGITRREIVGRVATAATEVRLPDNLLVSGETYALHIRVQNVANVVFDTEPGGMSFPLAEAGTVSGLLTAP
jgi:hypothetical protein